MEWRKTLHVDRILMIKWMWTFLLGQMDEIEKAESVIAVEMAKNNLC
jgi:hypothetical protein